jgi:formylmethanofuran dehydrogenase subunit E
MSAQHVAILEAAAERMPTADRCASCGEDFAHFSPNVEAFEISGEIVCDDCAEAIFEDNSQFGMGA